jgi:hypothetical protein
MSARARVCWWWGGGKGCSLQLYVLLSLSLLKIQKLKTARTSLRHKTDIPTNIVTDFLYCYLIQNYCHYYCYYYYDHYLVNKLAL